MKYLTLLSFAFIAISCSSTESSSEDETMEIADQETSFDLDKTTLTWTAFKTPEKIGVSGTFDDITLTDNSFVINAKSVNSNNPDRDPKLRDIFFGSMSDSLITGNYGIPTENKIPVTLTMNGVEKTFDFDYMDNDTARIVTGSIDMLGDFSGNAAYEAIHKACYDLHLGKTWTDVDLKVVMLK